MIGFIVSWCANEARVVVSVRLGVGVGVGVRVRVRMGVRVRFVKVAGSATGLLLHTRLSLTSRGG